MKQLHGFPPSGPVRLTEFRANVGEYVMAVERAGRSYTLTRKGKPVARLVPVDDVTHILPDGTVIGAPPLTSGTVGEPP